VFFVLCGTLLYFILFYVYFHLYVLLIDLIEKNWNLWYRYCR